MSRAARTTESLPKHSFYTRRQGGHFLLGDAIEVEVAEISGEKVKLALTLLDSTDEVVAAQADRGLVRATGSGYYRFRAGERHTLFTLTHVGKAVNINGRFRLTVLDVDAGGAIIIAVADA